MVIYPTFHTPPDWFGEYRKGHYGVECAKNGGHYELQCVGCTRYNSHFKWRWEGQIPPTPDEMYLDVRKGDADVSK
jgi:hypothetical protein